MDTSLIINEDVESWKTLMFLYNSALKEVTTKLERHNLPCTIEAIEQNLNDVAGIRVICSFPDDIYKLVEYLTKQDDITVIESKDYISHPKKNGYRSYHLIVEVPIFLTTEKTPMRVEVQFRPIGMDFWASLEHKLKYKQNIADAENITEELFFCADLISQLDRRMQQIRMRIDEANNQD